MPAAAGMTAMRRAVAHLKETHSKAAAQHLKNIDSGLSTK
jgi:hypothetical protein